MDRKIKTLLYTLERKFSRFLHNNQNISCITYLNIAFLNILQDMHGKICNDSQLYVHCKQSNYSNMHGNINNHIKTIKIRKK